MARALAGLIAFAALLPAGCGGDPEWQPTASTRELAIADCDDQVDTRMQLHGFPRRPSPETPQYRYRQEFFAKCMRDKGYERD